MSYIVRGKCQRRLTISLTYGDATLIDFAKIRRIEYSLVLQFFKFSRLSGKRLRIFFFID